MVATVPLNDKELAVDPEESAHSDAALNPSETSLSTQTVTIDEVLDHIPVGWFHYKLLFICGIAFAADSMEVALLSFLGTCAGIEWDLTNSERASIASFVFVGELLGSLCWGHWADKYGRKKCFTAACLLIAISGLLSAAAPSYLWLLIFRILVGFGIGCVTLPFDILAEFLPISYRGRYLLYIEYYWTFGTLLVNGIAWAALSSKGWRFLTLMTSIPVTISLVTSIVFLPESPRWLLSKGRTQEAERVLRQLIPNNMRSSNFPKNFVLKFRDTPSENTSGLDLINSPESRRIALPLASIWFLFGFSYFALMLLISRIYTVKDPSSSGSSGAGICAFDYEAIFISSVAEIIGVAVALSVVDCFGRIKIQTGLYLIAGAMIMFIGGVSSTWLSIVSWVGRASLIGAICITWVATPELFPTELRGTGHGLCNGVARIGSLLAPYFITNPSISPLAVGLALSLVNVILAILSYSLPETADKSLDNDSSGHTFGPKTSDIDGTIHTDVGVASVRRRGYATVASV